MRPQKYTLEQRKEWFGAACFSMVFAHNFSGLIARSWSTEAQGNIPAFFIPMTPKEKGTWSIFVDKGRVLGRPIPILPYRSSLSYTMTNPWISKQRSTIFLICTLLLLSRICGTYQRGVPDYIQSHNIDIKVFGCRWYDILSGKFFTIEYLPREDSLFADANGSQGQIIWKTGRAISARVAKWEDNADALRFG